MAFSIHVYFLVLAGTFLAGKGVGGLDTVREQTGFKRLFGNKKVKYKVWVTTGTQQKAGTDANVYITIHGSNMVSPEKELESSIFHNSFEKGETDEFKLKFKADLGVIKKIKIRKDTFGFFSDWNLEKVKIKTPDDKVYIFDCNCLLSQKTTLSRELYPEVPALGGCTGRFADADHCWSFDEVQSNISPDLKGGVPAMLKDGARIAASVARGKVACTLEKGSWIDMGNLNGQCISDPSLCVNGITMIFWARIEQSAISDNPSVPKEVISSGGIDSRSKGFSFFHKQNNWEIRVANGPQLWRSTISQNQIPLDKWFSFAFTWDKAIGLKYFINGKVSGSLGQVYDEDVQHANEFNDLTISKSNSNNRLEQMLPMDIDLFAVWYKVLPPEAIQQAFHDGGEVPVREGATTNYQACNPNPCINGGQCKIDVDEPSSYRCVCPWQYTGLICETPTAGTKPTTGAPATAVQTTGSSSITTIRSTAATSPTTAPGTTGLPTTAKVATVGVTTGKVTTSKVSIGGLRTGAGTTATVKSTAPTSPKVTSGTAARPTSPAVSTAKATSSKVSPGGPSTGAGTTPTVKSTAATRPKVTAGTAARPTSPAVSTAKATASKVSTGGPSTGAGTTPTVKSTAATRPKVTAGTTARPTSPAVSTAKATTSKVSTGGPSTGAGTTITVKSTAATRPKVTPGATAQPTSPAVSKVKATTGSVTTGIATNATTISTAAATRPTTMPSTMKRPTTPAITTAKATTSKVSTGRPSTGAGTTITVKSTAATSQKVTLGTTARPTSPAVSTAKATTGGVTTGKATTAATISTATAATVSAGSRTTGAVTTAAASSKAPSTGAPRTPTTTVAASTRLASTIRPTTAGPVPDFKHVINELMMMLNRFRGLHQCPEVTLTVYLSQLANQWAKKIAAEGIEKIDPRSTYGQLVCSHSSGNNIAKACAVKWYGAVKFFDWAFPKLTASASSFTQMVWKLNTDVGIAVAKGISSMKRENVGGKYYVVVLFNPGQDANANIKENVLPAAGISEPAPQAICPEGYSKLPQGSRSCFSLKTTPLSWDDALYGCALDNGTLASLQCKEESDLVLNLMKASNMKEAWIGLHDRSKEGRYIWIDGSTIPFSEWLQGEPNGGTSENCIAHTKGNYATGGWADRNCLETKAFVCEVPVPGYTTYKLTFNLTEPRSQYNQNNQYPLSLYPGVYSTCTPYIQSGNDLLRDTITRYFQAKNIIVQPIVNTIGCMPNGLSIVEVILKLGPEAGSDTITSLQTSIKENDGELELSNGASAKLVSVTTLNPGAPYCPSQCAATTCQPGCDSYCCTQSTTMQYPSPVAQQPYPVYTNTYPWQQCPAACTSNTNYCPPYCSARCCKRRVNIHRF